MTKEKTLFKTIDEYIALKPENLRAKLEELRQLIKKAAPEAEETISYQMPAFRFKGILVWFAVFKDHYGFFVLPETVIYFKDKLRDFKTSRGTIHFPLNKPIPRKLVTEIVKYRLSENKAK